MLRDSAVTDEEIFAVQGTSALDGALDGAVDQKHSREKRRTGDRTGKGLSARKLRDDAPSLTLSLATSSRTSIAASSLPGSPSAEQISSPLSMSAEGGTRFKRLFDVIASSTLLILTAPLMVVVALLVKLSSPGPIILQQRRLTKDGREFSMLKFRSMRCDAETASGPVLAQKNDSRVTAIGRLIRLTRLDELPQLLNVLRNDMSLIGPRPERPEIAAQLRREIPNFDRRLRVKAGLTGLAQVEMGYSSCASSYRRKIAFDRLYVKNQSLMLDCWIAFRTVWVMFTGKGAR
jgi:lipopolysaccharide/colanic/teichoic acid biosynthesis glycosyltransferase